MKPKKPVVEECPLPRKEKKTDARLAHLNFCILIGNINSGLAPIDGKESPTYKGKSSVLEYSALRKPTEDALWLKIDTGISPLKKPLPVNPIENTEENSRKIRGEFEETRTPKTIDINTPSFKPKVSFIFPLA